MPYDEATIRTILDSATDRMAECLLKPKPSYDVDGQKFDWTQYQQFLQKQIDWAREELPKIGGGFCEVLEITRVDG